MTPRRILDLEPFARRCFAGVLDRALEPSPPWTLDQVRHTMNYLDKRWMAAPFLLMFIDANALISRVKSSQYAVEMIEERHKRACVRAQSVA